MSDLFEYSEIFDEKIYNTFPKLKVNGNSPYYYLVLRGIVGNLNIKHTFSNTTFQQQVNYLDIRDYPGGIVSNNKIDKHRKRAIRKVIAELFKKCQPNVETLVSYISDSANVKDLEDVVGDRNLSRRNKEFFKTLNDEFSNFYYHTYKENHTLAFLHLYRILEYISYSFPLLYATSSRDFSKSFDSLKSFFSGDKDQGELKVFKFFIEKVMANEIDYKRLSIDINIVSDIPEHRERIYNTIIKICETGFFEEHRMNKNSKISVKFSEYSSFIITLRNRYFHLKNSHDQNMKSIDIVDSDFFFSLVNKKTAYFLSLVTLFVVKQSYFKK